MFPAMEPTPADQQPFHGIRVIEFGQFVAVPFCAQLLAEGGADVIKIESLDGDPTRILRPLAPMETRTFISRNRGKRSLPLNLRHADAPTVIDALLKDADVALMNFRPGLAERIGLGAEELVDRHPRLIVGSVTAFGKRGPDAGFAGMDIVVQARSGLMAANGRMADDLPAPGDPVSADYMCAMSLAFGISSALLRRERTGRGGIVDTSLMQAAMTLANNQLIRSEAVDGPVHEQTLERLAQQRQGGASFAEQASGMSAGRAMPLMKVYFRTYATADAPVAIACGSRSLRVRFLEALGLEDPEMDAADNEGKTEHYLALMQRAEVIFRSRSSAEWLAILQEAGVPVSTVKFPVELFDDEHARANGMFHTLEHPAAGDMTVLSPPVRMDGDGFRSREPAPAFASATREILAEIGFDDAAMEALLAAGATRAAPAAGGDS